MKTYVARIELPNGDQYDKLVGGVSKADALRRVTSWQTAGQVVKNIRKAAKKHDLDRFQFGCSLHLIA